MSGQEEQAIRASVEAFNRAMTEGALDEWLATMTDDVDFQSVTARAEGVVYHSHAELRGYAAWLREAFTETRIEVHELREIGEGVWAVLGRWHARGRESGMVIDTEWGAALQRVDGLAVWVRAFTSHTATLAAAEERAASLRG